jgi:SAM-dependent methyltransferase
MKILNPAIFDDLETGRPLRLDLGSGARKQDGYYGVDAVPVPRIDIVADLNEPLDQLPDDSVIEVQSHHTLEHVDNLVGLLRELHRLVRPDGRITVTVPHFSNPYGYSDPTHVRSFGLFTMYYFSDPEDQPTRKLPSHYADFRFVVEDVFIRFSTQGFLGTTIGRFMRWFVNLSFATQHFFERRLAWGWPADEIRYVMRPKKCASPP